MKTSGIVLTTATMLIASTLFAASFSVSTAAPVVDEADIAMLTQTDADWGSSVLWGDRPARGQTFTTGPISVGYAISAVTLRSAGNQAGNGTYYIRIGTISGSSFTQIASESVYTTTDVAVSNYVTFTLDTPLSLSPNTLHGFDIGRAGSGWMSYRNTDNASYPDGVAYNSGGSGVGGATIGTLGHDRVFHIDMISNVQPGTLFLFE